MHVPPIMKGRSFLFLPLSILSPFLSFRCQIWGEALLEINFQAVPQWRFRSHGNRSRPITVAPTTVWGSSKVSGGGARADSRKFPWAPGSVARGPLRATNSRVCFGIFVYLFRFLSRTFISWNFHRILFLFPFFFLFLIFPILFFLIVVVVVVVLSLISGISNKRSQFIVQNELFTHRLTICEILARFSVMSV